MSAPEEDQEREKEQSIPQKKEKESSVSSVPEENQEREKEQSIPESSRGWKEKDWASQQCWEAWSLALANIL